ncbi:hypothetical protein [Mangrovicoccus sp. HB161399]|uniref:hypothetical protein n=1 Tax=Mangrovicoccus sp. HB161399 TaxID=2720392 RepID=UPI001555A775|nr:hypothetical protein [Mangrovicoccus sp. HB161399]
MLRRLPANSPSRPQMPGGPQDAHPVDELPEAPAWAWIEVARARRFLAERHAATPGAADGRSRELMERALGGMDRPGKSGERE